MDFATNSNSEKIPEISAISALCSCLALSAFYVSSLYVWGQKEDRNHPSTVKKRFFSVCIVMLISPIFVYAITPKEVTQRISIWALLGFRLQGLLWATSIPLILTAILFLGPLATQTASGSWKLYLEPTYWLSNFQNLLWIRNHIVAPLSEEFTFRACMMPLLLQSSFQPMTAVLINSIFFGIGHLHHIIERIRSGMELNKVLIISFFQFGYTSIFGSYSAYLFARTGHFMAPFVAHTFCNHMGFPDIQEVLMMPSPKRILFLIIYVVGLLSWIILLPILTDTTWYSNNIYWKT